MVINLNLGEGGFVPLSVNKAVIPASMSVNIVPVFDAEHYVLTVKHKKGTAEYTLQYDVDIPVDITPICAEAGSLLMTVCAYTNGEKLCTWQVEPLELVLADGTVEPIPAIESMRAELDAMRAEVSALAGAVASLQEQIDGVTLESTDQYTEQEHDTEEGE